MELPAHLVELIVKGSFRWGVEARGVHRTAAEGVQVGRLGLLYTRYILYTTYVRTPLGSSPPVVVLATGHASISPLGRPVRIHAQSTCYCNERWNYYGYSQLVMRPYNDFFRVLWDL